MDRDTPRNIPDDELDEHLEQAFGARAPVPQPPDARASFAALRGRLGAPEVQCPTPTHGVGKSSSRGARASVAIPSTRPRGVVGGAWRWAALATSVVVLGIGVAIGSLVHHASVRSLGREYATVAGQRLSVTLVDGTQLTLAPASRLRIAVDYGRLGSGREVELEGEAYFAVTHDAAHPFAVGAHGVVTRDVGTVFDVRAYPEDAGARIGVVEGAVAVSTAAACRTGAGGQGAVGARAARPPSSDVPDEGCGAQVRAGDVATVVNDKVAVEHGVDVASLTEWTAGRLVFDRTPMTTVVAEVSRWYGIDVRLGDPALAAQAFSATLTTESARDAVAVLADALRLRVETRGPATFTLYRLGA